MRRGDSSGPPGGDAGGAALHGLRVQALNLGHLARRFFGSLRPGGPSADDEAWVRAVLVAGSGAHELWGRMSGADRRHAVGVARQVARFSTERPILAAALLHDVGKIESGLGTFSRAVATLVGGAGGRRRAAVWAARHSGVRARLGRYLRHAPIGAGLLRDAGAAPLTVAWAGEHHLPRSSWTVPQDAGMALKAADDD